MEEVLPPIKSSPSKRMLLPRVEDLSVPSTPTAEPGQRSPAPFTGEVRFGEAAAEKPRLHLWVPPVPSDTGVAAGSCYAFAMAAVMSSIDKFLSDMACVNRMRESDGNGHVNRGVNGHVNGGVNRGAKV